MQFRILCAEAWRNFATGTSRAASFACLIGAVMIVLGTADAAALRTLISSGSEYRSAAAAVKTLAAADAVDGVTCQAIASAEGISSSGAIRQLDDPMMLEALPGSTLPTFEVSPGFAGLLGIGTTTGGIMVSSTVASRLGISAGDELPLRSKRVMVGGVFAWPDDGRRSGLGYAALVPVESAGAFDECWAEAWPEADELDGLLRATIIASRVDPSTPPKLGAVNSSLGTEFRGAEQFEHRHSRFAPLLAFTAAAAIAAGLLRSRRLELAAALHFGVRRDDVLALSLIETLLGLAVPTVVAGSIALAIGRADLRVEDGIAVSASSTAAIAASVAGAFAGTLLAWLTVDERHLVRLFKERR